MLNKYEWKKRFYKALKNKETNAKDWKEYWKWTSELEKDKIMMNTGFATEVNADVIYKSCEVTGCPVVSSGLAWKNPLPGDGAAALGYFQHLAQDQKQKECNMCNEACVMVEDESLEQDTRKHLKNRAHEVLRAATEAAREKYNMEDLIPKTWGEFRSFIRQGFVSVKDAYKTKGDDDKGQVRYDWQYAIEFRDPSKPKDQAGFDAAKKDIDREYESVIDAIMTLEPREAREELKAFQAKY